MRHPWNSSQAVWLDISMLYPGIRSQARKWVTETWEPSLLHPLLNLKVDQTNNSRGWFGYAKLIECLASLQRWLLTRRYPSNRGRGSGICAGRRRYQTWGSRDWYLCQVCLLLQLPARITGRCPTTCILGNKSWEKAGGIGSLQL